MRLWEKYLLREIAKVFVFFSLCFFLTFVLIDFALHMQQLTAHPSLFSLSVGAYYLCQFVRRAYLIFPLAFLIATIKVLQAMNTKRELVALLAGGLSMRQILRPFFLFAGSITLFILIAFQWLVPPSLSFIDEFEVKASRLSRLPKSLKSSVHSMPQKNGVLLYQRYADKEELFFDVYYIDNKDTVWQMDRLKRNAPHYGYAVNQLQRNQEGLLEKVSSHDVMAFPGLEIDFTKKSKKKRPFENRSITSLIFHIINGKSPAIARAYLIFELVMPFLSLLIALALPPFCIRFSRYHSHFMLYAIAIFAFIAFFTFIDAGVVLAAASTVSPFLALGLVPSLCTLGFSFLFWKKVH